MRVLQVMEATLGGTRRYLEDVARACSPGTHKNGLVYSLVRADEAFYTLLKELQSAGWETFEIPMRRSLGLHDIASVLALRSVFKRFVPDIVHAHSSKAGGLSRMAMIALSNKPAIAYTPNSIAVDLSRTYALAERVLAPRLDALIAVGPSEQSQLEALNLVSPARIPIVVPTVDTIYFQPRNRDAARIDLGYGDHPLVVAIGRLTLQKDPLGFVKFVEELRKLVPDIRALWVGDGEMRKEFEAALRAARLNDSVAITGWVADVRPFLAACNLFVSTSAYESFGYVTAEAFASGRAVIASAITGTIDIVRTDTGLQLYEVGDYTAAAKLASVLLEDEDLSSAVAERGRESVIEAFAFERTRLQLAAAYKLAIEYRSRIRGGRIEHSINIPS